MSDAPKALRMGPSPLALPAGMRDMLPARAALRRALARAVMGAFQRRGYDPVIPPAFEREEVVARGLGARARADLVRFLDPDTGDVLALRPDMTPQIARIVATRYRDAPPPVRLAYEGSVVRRPRGRSRRHRQVAQAGIECVGLAGVDADVEVILAACEALDAAGLRDWRVELSHAGVTAAALAEAPLELRDDVAEALARGDRAAWERLLPDHPRAVAALGAITALAGGPEVLDEAARVLPPAYDGGAVETLLAVRERLAACGHGDRLLVDLGELRGDGYYTGVLFQVVCGGVGDAVASGGRYDDLLARYGAPMPATGCAVDLEVLEEALAARGVAPVERGPERVVVGGAPTERAPVAAGMRRDGRCVAEIDARDDDAVRAFARAHGFARAFACRGGAVDEVPLQGGAPV